MKGSDREVGILLFCGLQKEHRHTREINKQNYHNLTNRQHNMAYMSQKGYDDLVAKLKHMESVDRPAASAAIAEARDKGDLSENAEYDAAKEWQSKLETQIALLKQTILDAKIIDTRHMDTSSVQIMATVGLKNANNGMEMKYTIVSATEADHRAGKISVETPIAQGLLGKKVGETANIRVPQGEIQLEITSISYDI
jgi:transcription elongation factor GreA